MDNDELAKRELAILNSQMEIQRQARIEKIWRNTRRLRWVIWIMFILLFFVYALSYYKFPWDAEVSHSFRFMLNLLFFGMIIMFICIENVLAGLWKGIELLREEMSRLNRDIGSLREIIVPGDHQA